MRDIYLEDIPLAEARARLLTAANPQPLPGENVPLSEALGRVTAEPIFAAISSPHYHSSAMDGYAVQAQATTGATETRPLRLALGTQAQPVNTGDPLPAGTNAVIMIEDVQQVADDAIEIRAPVVPYQHVRLMGEDMVATELVLPANHRIRSVDLGAMAGCGHAQASVRRRPRVIIIPTGSELIAPTERPAPGQIVEYNSLILRAQVIESGGAADVTAIAPDDRDRLRTAIQAALAEQPDLLLVLSGSSAGSHDFTASIVRELGELLVHGVAVRPGHPVIIGAIGGVPLIGVPGYPVSAALTGELFVQPLLARWLGLDATVEDQPRAQAIMTRKLMSPIGDDDFVRVTLARVGERLLAAPLNRGAGVITSLVRADGLALIPRFSEGVDAGQAVEVRLYHSLRTIERTVAVVGSHDPMIDLLAQFLAVRYPGDRLTSAGVGSVGGLVALRRQEAHIAGSHLLDTETGEYNFSYVAKYLPGIAVRLITFAHREQGFYVQPGNPHGVHNFGDLPRVRFVNRQRGAGTRVLLDYELGQRGIAPESIAGYEREENTHLAVAAAVASGMADCGMGVRSGALALGLEFVAIGWERYDLVIPHAHLDHPGVRNVIALLDDAEFRAALGAQPGYDTRETGTIQLDT